MGPTEATIVFRASQPPPGQACNGNAQYVGSVAIGSGSSGYAVTLPYQPNNCNNGGGQTGTVDVFSFAKDGSRVDNEGSLGSSIGFGGFAPHLAANATSGFWAHSENNGITVSTKGGSVGSVSPSGNALVPAGLVADASSVYLATYQQPGLSGQDPNSPRYPCCGPVPGADGSAGALYRLPATGAPSATALAPAPKFFNNSMLDNIVGNGSALFYLEHGDTGTTGSVVRIDVDAAGSASAPVKTAITLQGRPVGLAADSGHVAWSTTADYGAFSNSTAVGTITDPCSISVLDLTGSGTPELLLSTTKFACFGIAVDSEAVYFTILHSDLDPHSSGNLVLHGDGIGRISFSTRKFESIALGMKGLGVGPRRIFLDGDKMYAVDPFAVAWILKSALDNRTDFAE